MFSRRSQAGTSTNELTVLRRRLQAKGLDWLDLTVSNPTRVSIEHDEAAIRAALSGGDFMRYQPRPYGLPAAREAVAADLRRQGVSVLAEQVVLTASTSESYGFLFKLLCDPGDEILVPVPSYPLLAHLCRFEAVKPVPYPLRYDGRWFIDEGAVREALTDRTRAIIVVSPNNPTGSLTRNDEFRFLASLGFPLICDEVFAAYRHGADPSGEVIDAPLSALEVEADLVFSLGGLSKLAALPQFKVGWMVLGGRQQRVDAALERLALIADTWLSLSTPSALALGGLLAASERSRSAILERVRANHRVLLASVPADSPISVPRIEAGWVAPIRLPAVLDDEAWALHFLAEHAVLVHPGHLYDFPKGTHVVVSLLVEEEVFAEGLGRLIAAVDSVLANPGLDSVGIGSD